jgi:hypothetical protein
MSAHLGHIKEELLAKLKEDVYATDSVWDLEKVCILNTYNYPSYWKTVINGLILI